MSRLNHFLKSADPQTPPGIIDQSLRGKKLATFLILALLIGYWAYRQERPADHAPDSNAQVAESQTVFPDVQTVHVERCVDGDTLLVRSESFQWRVRLIGCNTPETVKPGAQIEPFGPEATAYTKQRIADWNETVTLVADGDRTDQYGRRLAFVYLGSNRENLLNEELIRNGLARATVQYRFSSEMKERLKAAQNEAKEAKRGIWGE